MISGMQGNAKNIFHRRRLAAALLGWAAMALAYGADTDEPDVLAIRDVTIVDLENGRLRPGQTVVWNRSRIISVGANEVVVVPAGARLVNGTEKYLMPGLWDMHVHAWADPAEPDLSSPTERRVLPLFIVNGVTAVRDTGDGSAGDCRGTGYRESPVPTKKRWDFEARAGLRVGPRFVETATFAVHGPDDGFCGPGSPADARKLVHFFKDEGAADVIKIYSGVARDAYFALMDEARRVGIPVMGHKPDAVSYVEAADAGQRSMEHARDMLRDSFPGAQELQRSGGSVNLDKLQEIVRTHDPKILHDIFDAMIRNDAYYTPTHVTRLFDWQAAANDRSCLDDPRLALMTDARRASIRKKAADIRKRASRPGDAAIYRAFFEKGLEVTRLAQQAGVNILAGTDTGSKGCIFPGSSLHDELSWMVKAGLTPWQALSTATVNAARYVGRLSDFGSISAGKLADMVLLERNPLVDISNARSIHAVVMNGRLYDQEQIRRIAAEVWGAVSP